MYARGVARVGRKTKWLCQRLKRGEIAIVDHQDLDSVAVEGLLEKGVAAVVNASASVSGRFPNEAPLRLLRAGVPVVDEVGSGITEKVKDGDVVEIRGEEIWCNGKLVAKGRILTERAVRERLEQARAHVAEELEKFVRNTLQYVVREMDFFLKPQNLPELDTPIKGRPTLVVVRGEGYKEDLRAVRAYIEDVKPVLIGVDGGADALLEAGFKPDIIVGDMDSVSDEALRSGAELVVHAYPSGEAPGMRRLKELGLEKRAKILPAPGTSEDVALLLAYEKGASLIVAVGSHFSLLEFLSKGREGMSSTFLVRLRVGDKLVDAKGVSKLYRPRIRWFQILLLVLVGVVATWLVVVLSPAVQRFVRLISLLLR